MTGTPYFIIIHGTDIFPYNPRPFRHFIKRMVWKILPFLLSSASGLLANSEYTRDLLQRIPGIRSDRIATLHPPVGGQFFEPVSEEEQNQVRSEHSLLGKRVILTVGRLVPRKGVFRVLETLPGILETEPSAHYLIVGDGSERESLESRVTSLGLQAAVSFAGDVPHGQMRAYYAVADVFAMISHGVPEENEVETFGIVYLEAAAFAKPVVAGTQGGVVDAVLDGRTGLLVDPHDSKAIAQAITFLLTNPDKAQVMGVAGRERARAQFTPEVIAGDALRAISEFLQDPGLAGRD
jgi:phosphatidylinositol alpha-1,6-mannosyltransferase